MSEWKQIAGYEDIYEVSSEGQIRRTTGGQGAIAGKVRKPSISPSGYPTLNLCKDGVTKGHMVHRLVAEAFHGASDLQVNHINGIKSDNRADNLEWITASENTRHAIATGLMPQQRDEYGRYAIA